MSRRPYICSNMRGLSTPGMMHLPGDFDIDEINRWFEEMGVDVRAREDSLPAQLIFHELTEVKPMNIPSSLIFYMDYQYPKGR